MNRNHVALIMAGGQGTRFWPYSTPERPKQFLNLIGDSSLIKQTYDRLTRVVPEENIYAVADERYRRLLSQSIPAFSDDNFIAEPSPRNTAPCLIMANIVLKKRHPDACVLVAPADHYISDVDAFAGQMRDALEYASNPVMVTCGIKPHMPHTGYGYIRFMPGSTDDCGNTSFHQVLEFTEKPTRKRAKAFLASGDYLWNSGMFVYKLDHFREFLRRYAVDFFEDYVELESLKTADAKFAEVFNRIRAESIDYALMEKVKEVVVMPAEFLWNDVGAWLSIHELNRKDDRGNVNVGANILLDTRNCLVFSTEEKPVAVLGLEEVAVIQTDHGVLVAPLDQMQRVKEIVAHMK